MNVCLCSGDLQAISSETGAIVRQLQRHRCRGPAGVSLRSGSALHGKRVPDIAAKLFRPSQRAIALVYAFVTSQSRCHVRRNFAFHAMPFHASNREGHEFVEVDELLAVAVSRVCSEYQMMNSSL